MMAGAIAGLIFRNEIITGLFWFLPVFFLIAFVLNKHLSYQRAVFGGALAGLLWALPTLFAVVPWLDRASGYTGVISYSYPAQSYFLSIVMGATVGLVIWLPCAMINRRSASRA
jgi:hypothetical protein